MLEPLKTLEAAQILKECTTKGSGPLQLMAIDQNIYYAKTTNLKTPRIEIINEIICAYFAKCLNLNVPDFCLMSFDNDVLQEYIKENEKFSSRYTTAHFSTLFFASKEVPNVVEFDQYIQMLKTKSEFKLFNYPMDLLKIGMFDLWVGNKDRHSGNPNILISQSGSKFNFFPIDHSAAFAFATDYKQVNKIFLHLPENFRILCAPFIKSITKFVDTNLILSLQNEMLQGFDNVLSNIDFIFNQVPSDLGFGKKSKAHLKNILSDYERNKLIASSYKNYL